MVSRIARVRGAVLCAALICSLVVAAPAAAAKQQRAHSSVIGGTLANLQEWGFTAAVLSQTSLCTGAVLSPTKVLTTAHCVVDLPTMLVRTNSIGAFSGGEVSMVDSAAIAPGWMHGFESDLAVLTLRTPTTAPPIQIANSAEDAAYDRPGGVLAIAGFGNRNPLIVGKQRIGLLTATNVIVRRCGLPSWAICDAGGRAGTAVRRFRGRKIRRKVWKAICQGDSGGPLVARTAGGPRLIGIAEASSSPPKRNPFFFVHCGLKGFPSLHTRVLSYLGFVQSSL